MSFLVTLVVSRTLVISHIPSTAHNRAHHSALSRSLSFTLFALLRTHFFFVDIFVCLLLLLLNIIVVVVVVVVALVICICIGNLDHSSAVQKKYILANLDLISFFTHVEQFFF